MRILAGTVRGTFTGRPNRWTITALVGGRERYAFCPNPGRLRELFVPGAPVRLRPRRSRGRRTTHDLVAVEADGLPVPVDPRVANALVLAALRRGALPPFRGYDGVVREFPFGGSRIDFYLPGRPPCLLEVKSCSLVRNGVALFPDAPTARGLRHLRALGEARRRGLRAALFFVVQRPGARLLRPFDAVDPAFAAALRAAPATGVEVLAWGCRLARGDLALAGPLPVDLSPPPGGAAAARGGGPTGRPR